MEETNLIPDDLVEEILQFLPTESVARFICVSKKWRTIIFNQINNSEEEGFLVPSPCRVRYLNLTQLFELRNKIVNLLQFSCKDNIRVIGSVNGLILCLQRANRVLILDNPLTRSHWTINSNLNPAYYTFHGFGYEKSKDDYVIMIIDHYNSNGFSSAHIWTSKTQNWVPSFKIFDPEWFIFSSENRVNLNRNIELFVNGCLYWKLWKPGVEGVAGFLCFKLETREFKVIDAPRGSYYDSFVLGCSLSIAKLGEGLCTDVWKLECGNWKKIMSIPYMVFSLDSSDSNPMVPAFGLKNGEFIYVSYYSHWPVHGFYLYDEETQTYSRWLILWVTGMASCFRIRRV